MTKETKIMEEYEDEVTKELSTIKNYSQRQGIQMNVDLSVLKLSTGILESLSSLSIVEALQSREVFRGVKLCFQTLSVAFYSPQVPIFEIQPEPINSTVRIALYHKGCAIVQLKSPRAQTVLHYAKTAAHYSVHGCTIAQLKT